MDEDDAWIATIWTAPRRWRTGCWRKGAKVIDVGTGAGFRYAAADSAPRSANHVSGPLNKRILFLEDALKRLGLTAATLHARAEDAAKMAAHREQYDAAVSRAVANAATLEELTLPFVKKGGVAIAWKGPGSGRRADGGAARGILLGGTVRHGGCADPRRRTGRTIAAADG